MRPHVELVQQCDLMWHEAELPGSEGRARQRNLSYDEESGAASTIVVFDSAWSRPAGYHHADTEWVVLAGEIRLGGQSMGEGGYFRAPAGLLVPELEAKEGTEIMLYREYGDFGFSLSRNDRDKFIPHGGNTDSDEPGILTIRDSHKMEWIENIYPGRTDGLRVKMLYEDPSAVAGNQKGFVSLIVWAPIGWADHRLEHHPVFEEAFTIRGALEYSYGTQEPGTYLFRPAMTKHGRHLTSDDETGWTAVIRTDGHLINWNTIEDEVVVSGNAENYDPAERGPILFSSPVRSKSTGPWSPIRRQLEVDEDGRHYRQTWRT